MSSGKTFHIKMPTHRLSGIIFCFITDILDVQANPSYCQNPQGPGVGEEVLAENLGGGVQPNPQNPYPIYDHNLQLSQPNL